MDYATILKKALANDRALAAFGSGDGPTSPSTTSSPKAFPPTSGASSSSSAAGLSLFGGSFLSLYSQTQSSNGNGSNRSLGSTIPIIDQNRPGQRRALARYQAIMDNGKSYCPDGGVCLHPNHNPEGDVHATATRDVTFIKCPFPNNIPYNPYTDNTFIKDPQYYRLPVSSLLPPYFNQFDSTSLEFNAPFNTFSFSRNFFLEVNFFSSFSFDLKVSPLNSPLSCLQLFTNCKKLPNLDYPARFGLYRSLLATSLSYALTPQIMCVVKDHGAPLRSSIEPRFVRLCDKCGGALISSVGNCTYFPLHSVCKCRVYQPVILDPTKMPDWYLTLQYSEGFQRADQVTKASMLEALGYDYNELVLKCGMAGPVCLQNVGADLRDRRDIYFSFLVNGIAHFVLTPNSLQDLFFLVFERQQAGTLFHAPAGASPMSFLELIISFLRLPSPLRFYRALCYYNRKNKLRVMLNKTLFNIYGCPGVHDVDLTSVEMPDALFDSTDGSSSHEELQAGFFDWFVSGSDGQETLLDTASQVAELDKVLSVETAKLMKHPVFWDNLVKVLRNVFPSLPNLSPSAREAFVTLFAYYSFDAHVSVSYHIASLFYKEKMDKKEVVVLDALHGLLFVSHWLLQLWKYWSSSPADRKQKKSPSYEVLESAVPAGHAFWATLFPQGNPFSLRTMMEELRFYSLTRTFVMDIYGALRAILSWIIHWVKTNVLGMQDEFDVFIRQVDEIETVWVQADQNTTTFQRQMISNRKLRVKMAHLLTLGTQLKRKLEVTNGPKHLLSAVKDRLDKIRKMISGSQATFIGVEGKIKPMTVYFYGEPGVGKSIMIPHLCHDLCYVLQDEPFDKSRDLYVITPKTAFHDQYAYQRFAVRNDVLQMTDEEMRTNEIFDLINMADETPYPLEIAHCEGKGQVYFTSPYLFLTSNFDIRRRTAELSSRMVEPDALIRRMDFIVRVERPGEIVGSGFQRDAMRFTIESGKYHGMNINWYELVDLISEAVLDNFDVSFGANTVTLSDEERTILDRVRDRKDAAAFVEAMAPPPVEPVVYPSKGLSVKQAYNKAKTSISKILSSYRENPEAWYDRPRAACGTVVPPLLDKINEKIQSINPIPPPSRIERALAYCAPWGVPLSDMAYNHVTLYDYFSPLVKVGICAMGLIGAIELFKALSSIINAVRKMKESEKIEVCPNLSGGDVEYPRGKRVMRAVAKKFMRREFPQGSCAESSWQSQNGPILEQAVYKNLCMVVAENRKVNGLFVFGHVLCLPQHIFDMVEGDVITILLPGCVQVTVDLNDMEDEEVFIAESHHLVFLDLKRPLGSYSTHADLRKYFIESTRLPSGFESQVGAIFSYRTSSLSSIGLLSRLLVTNIRPDLGNFELYDDARCTTYNVARSVRGSVVTMNGDCGAPWILDHKSNLGAKIAGIHVSSDRLTMTGRATMITKEMIMHVSDYFRFCVPKEVAKCDDTQQTVLPHEQPPELLQSVDIVGKSEIVNHEPSKTALRHSIWYGVRPTTKVPSRLRKFKTQDGREIDPHQVNFSKWVKVTRRFPVKQIRATYPYIEQWYPRPAPDKRRVLTLEQAVFGEGDGVNTSIEPNTSVGHPWKEQGYARKDLFTLEPQWISDELKEAVRKLIEGEETDVIVLDNLKDERLKVSKVETGDTRIFNIFPVHFNIALKMYFGDFVHYLIQNFRGHPIRMGTSALPDDWGDLYEFLTENNGHIIAGDMGGWDHRCHFEVMMAAIEWINEWYDDDHGDVRRRLGRMSFEPYHWNNGTIFRARCGMPSGSYLTTACNSLGVLMYIYMWAMDVLGDDLPPDHGFRIRPAIYGDDHIVSVFDYPELNQMSLTQWFGSYGIPYTDERKEAPTKPYTTIEEAAFLKRRFVKRKGYVWGPLEKDQLYQMIQWYRDSATTRRMCLKERSGQILDTVLNEAFFHGPVQYAKIKKELLEWAEQKACLDLSAFAPKFEVKWRLFMGDDKPPPIRYLSIAVPGDLE